MLTLAEKAWYYVGVVAKSMTCELTAQKNKSTHAVLKHRFFMRIPSSFIRAGWVVDTERYAGSLVPALSAITQSGPFLCVLTDALPIKTGEHYV